ncbi:hypothetical protein BO86DRAFT_110197 [Aspergillus japonicus CBS 114.51]|uniref:Secreted protein n=1 Tax=Aspergillus japonicus CBS 114.51 TaxID=1448312 RepID=A0A8T8XDR5_ASPJA|nr:hypothetical protein BO86DRAFT_110197 [Aspergillus japonicus CBS 114.51]RAH86436.1 hypothetical protein BO86DRAFT_110197 [Aspergillus japonicus CBS 114.51]
MPPACRSNLLGLSMLLARSAGVSHRAYGSPHWMHTCCRWGRSEPQAFPCLEQAHCLLDSKKSVDDCGTAQIPPFTVQVHWRGMSLASIPLHLHR